MKRILMAASALAVLGFATGAAANDTSKNFTVNGFARAECHIHAPTTTVKIGDIVDHDGFVRSTVAQKVATALTNAGITAWCTGNTNGVNLYRTALVNQVHNGSGGQGTQDANGFDTAVIYDIDVNISGAVRSDGATPLEGTSDGQGQGPGFGAYTGITVSDFGATGHGSAVTFVPEAGFNPSAVSKELSGATDTGPTTDFTSDSDRLAAGPYQSTVTLVLRPGV